MVQPGDPIDPNPGYPPDWSSGPYGQYPPYPPPGYGYPPYPPPDLRPGAATAAAVLGYIGAGLLILAGILLFFGASIVSTIEDVSGQTYHILTTELVVDGLLNLIAAGLLIGGAVGLTGRSAPGRTVLTVGCGIVLVQSVYWLLRSDAASASWAFVFGALAVVALVLAWLNPVSAWLGGAYNGPPPPPPYPLSR